MRNIFKYGFMSVALAFGLILVNADTANAQNRRATREYRQDVREAQREYRRDVRRGENPRRAMREYREDVRDARREYVQNVRRDRNGWYWYQNGRRMYRPSTTWIYRDGYFIRRY